MKHYRERIQSDLAAVNNYKCPLCEYLGKDKQTIYRHYTGKHKVKYILNLTTLIWASDIINNYCRDLNSGLVRYSKGIHMVYCLNHYLKTRQPFE